jgi:hypothetical protein
LGRKVGCAAKQASWAAEKGEVGRAEDLGQKQEGKKGRERKPLLFSKELTKIEFKHKFEFKHIKTMHQHVCNSKLL